ncbi:hypothetical protein ENBRE01_1358 [Enteropsectra breve]|nr:hypothetical protein ENBRE01_1358 [Enteropsectra breve]
MRRAYKIVFLGNTSVGKTTLISQYLYNKVQEATPTIGIDYLSTAYELDGHPIRLQLWDTAGQERFHSIIGNYTRNTFLAVVVASFTDINSVEKIKTWINDYVYSHNSKEEVRVLIVANKMDLEGDVPEITSEEIEKIAREQNLRFCKASALTKQGIKAMADAIDQYIREELIKEADLDAEELKKNVLHAKPKRKWFCF